MSAYPRELTGAEISPRLDALVRAVSGRLLDGPAPQHRILQGQLASSRIESITLTGAGLFANFAADTTPLVEPAEMIGGEVLLNVEGLDAPAGSLVKVVGGRLGFLEIYTYGNIAWPDDPHILSFGESIPLSIPAQAT